MLDELLDETVLDGNSGVGDAGSTAVPRVNASATSVALGWKDDAVSNLV